MQACKHGLLAKIEAGDLAVPERPTVAGYRLHESLGEGGMGEVWAATTDDEHAAKVAIKLMRPVVSGQSSSRRRFEREARALLAIDHPGVVRVRDVGRSDDGRPFFVMDKIEGTTLRRHLRRCRGGVVSWEEAAELLTQLAAAFGAAHRAGVVHRDIKPSNILRSSSVDAVTYTVIDFGLAADGIPDADFSMITRAGEVLGTPAYMSPEALRGELTDARSDIYSLGCVLYEALEGTRCFAGDTVSALANQHLHRPVPMPELPAVPRPLREQVQALLLRMLAKRPDDRFATMAELSAAVAAVEVGGTPLPLPRRAQPTLSGLDTLPRTTRRLRRGVRSPTARTAAWLLVCACASVVSGTVAWKAAQVDQSVPAVKACAAHEDAPRV